MVVLWQFLVSLFEFVVHLVPETVDFYCCQNWFARVVESNASRSRCQMPQDQDECLDINERMI